MSEPPPTKISRPTFIAGAGAGAAALGLGLYQFKDWRSPHEPAEAPWKALHLAGGYGHLHYGMFYGAPSHAPRGAPVEVARVAVKEASAGRSGG